MAAVSVLPTACHGLARAVMRTACPDAAMKSMPCADEDDIAQLDELLSCCTSQVRPSSCWSPGCSVLIVSTVFSQSIHAALAAIICCCPNHITTAARAHQCGCRKPARRLTALQHRTRQALAARSPSAMHLTLFCCLLTARLPLPTHQRLPQKPRLQRQRLQRHRPLLSS